MKESMSVASECHSSPVDGISFQMQRLVGTGGSCVENERAEPTEINAVHQILVHFLDAGWKEIIESLHSDEESGHLYDTIESAHAKLCKLSRRSTA